MNPEAALPQSASSSQLLLVEDEESLRTLLATFLQRAGYSVLAAGGGEEALQIFTPEPQRFQAAILDLTLPDMSGEALLARIRAVRADLPVVVSSGSARSTSEFATQDAPVRFLQKPFLPARLIEALAELLAVQSSSPASAS